MGKEEKDKCVHCGKETEYVKNTPVDARLHYIEGAGQLCPACYIQIYGCGCADCLKLGNRLRKIFSKNKK